MTVTSSQALVIAAETAEVGLPVGGAFTVRRLARVQHGLEPPDGLLPQQERYDLRFVDAAGRLSMRAVR